MKEKMFLVALTKPKIDPVFFGIFTTLENASEAIRVYLFTEYLTAAQQDELHDATSAEIDEAFAKHFQKSGYLFDIFKVAPDNHTLSDVFMGERVRMLSAVEMMVTEDDYDDADDYEDLQSDLHGANTTAGMSCLPFDDDIQY